MYIVQPKEEAFTSSYICLQGLLEFLAHEPYYTRAHWNHLLLKPLEQHGPDGALPLMHLLKGVMLRRTKRHVGEQLY